MAEQNGERRRIGTGIGVLIIVLAVISLAIVIVQITAYPRTDDAEVFANFIGIAPQVEGPITHLDVRDNQFVHAGDLLYTIDDRPYQYALQRAQSEQAALEGEIIDEQRRIAAQQTSVAAARASAENQAADVLRSQALELIREELAPYPGRAAVVSRMVISSVIVMILVMTFRIPGALSPAITPSCYRARARAPHSQVPWS